MLWTSSGLCHCLSQLAANWLAHLGTFGDGAHEFSRVTRGIHGVISEPVVPVSGLADLLLAGTTSDGSGAPRLNMRGDAGDGDIQDIRGSPGSV